MSTQKVIDKLQELTNQTGSLVELANAFAEKYPNAGPAILALKDFVYSEENDAITAEQILKILDNIQ